MTLQELIDETLVQKHIRLCQERCRHPELYSTSVSGPTGTSAQCFCLECGKVLDVRGDLREERS